MARIRLKGLNSVTKKLAHGGTRTYWYAWKGGPPLQGQPGSPEFLASYNEAVAGKRPTAGKTLQCLIDYFQTTTESCSHARGLHQTNKDHRTEVW